jgi:hypothetical protein
VIGRPVSSILDVATSENRTVLRHFPQAGVRSAMAESSEGISSNEAARSRWHFFTDRIRHLGPNELFHTILGGIPVQFLDVEDDDNDDDDGDGIVEDGYDDVDVLDAPEQQPDA